MKCSEISDDGCTIFEHTKPIKFVHFKMVKMVNFMKCEIYLNKKLT